MRGHGDLGFRDRGLGLKSIPWVEMQLRVQVVEDWLEGKS